MRYSGRPDRDIPVDLTTMILAHPRRGSGDMAQFRPPAHHVSMMQAKSRSAAVRTGWGQDQTRKKIASRTARSAG